MNKWQIILPLAAIALAVLLLAVQNATRRAGMNRSDATTQMAIAIAWDLEAKTNSTSLDYVPRHLSEALEQFLTTPTAYRETVEFGDEAPPLGDGTATHRLYLRNSHDQVLALRLRYEPTLKKFHVIGFSHSATWPGH